MTDVHSLTALLRERAGKGPARATRRAERIPAVIYGNKTAPTLISLEPRQLEPEILKTGYYTTLFDIQVNGTSERVLPRDVHFDPVTDKPVHADFLRVTDQTRVRVRVPVTFTNEGLSPGLKRGGVLNVVRHEVDVVCQAGNIPRQIVIDVTGLDIGDSVHISMVKLAEGVRPAIADRDFTIATIAPPTVHKTEVEEQVAAATAATPEGAAAAPAAGAAAPAAGAPAAAPAAAKPGEKKK
jgi:large subunit ribosomal protein L25